MSTLFGRNKEWLWPKYASIYVLQASIPAFQRAVLKKAWRIGSEMAPHPKPQPSHPVTPPPSPSPPQTVVTAVISREVIKLSSAPLIVCSHGLRVTSNDCVILWWVCLNSVFYNNNYAMGPPVLDSISICLWVRMKNQYCLTKSSTSSKSQLLAQMCPCLPLHAIWPS